MVLFLKRIIQDECGELDGSTTVHLPYTKQEYYHQYRSSHTQDLHVTLYVFRITWLDTFPHVKGKLGVLKDTVTKYLNNLAEECGTREESNDGNIYLPHRTKKEVYKLFDFAYGSDTHVTVTEFNRIWRHECPHVKVKGDEVPEDIFIQFMSNFLEKYDYKTSTEEKGAIYLPFSSKMELYRLYQSTLRAEKRSDTCLHKSTFYRIWNDVFPYVKLKHTTYGSTVENFLSTLVHQVGRQCQNGSGGIDLPYSSKKEVYNLYLASETSDPDVSLSLFNRYWHNILPHVRTRDHKTQQNFIQFSSVEQFLKNLVDERVLTQKDDPGMAYLDFKTPRTVYEQYVNGNADCVSSYEKFLDTWESSSPHVMTLAEKCPHIHRNITQFVSKAIEDNAEDNAKCLDKQKYEHDEARHNTQLYKQYISTEHVNFHVTKRYFNEILNTQWHVTDAILQFLSKLVKDYGQEQEENGKRVVYLLFISKGSVYQRYIDTHDKELRVVKSTFLGLWRKYFPNVNVNRDLVRNNVVKMLSDLAETCGDKQQRNPAGNPLENPTGNSTGNPAGNSEGIVNLPYRSKKDVYDLFMAKGLGHLPYYRFVAMWKMIIPHIRVKGSPLRDAVEQFLSKLVQEVGKEDEHDNEIIVLPYGSKQDVYKMYLEAHGKDLHMEYGTFTAIWKNDLSHVRVKGSLLRDAVEQFLSNLVQEVGKEDEHDNEIIVLPYGSKKDVYKMYIEAHGKDLHMEYETFRVIWKNDFFHIRTKYGLKNNDETT